MLIYPCSQFADEFAGQGLGYIGRAHLGRVVTEPFEFRHGYSLDYALHTLFGKTCGNVARMEIQKTVDIQESHLLPWHEAVRWHRCIFVQGQPCPLEHSKRSDPPMATLRIALEIHTDLSEKRFDAFCESQRSIQTDLAVWMRLRQLLHGLGRLIFKPAQFQRT